MKNTNIKNLISEKLRMQASWFFKVILTIVYIIVIGVSASQAQDLYCLEFDGKDEYVNVEDHNDLDLTSKGSVEAWIYIDKMKDYAGIIHKGNRSDFLDEAYSLQIWNNDRVVFILGYGNNGWDSVMSSFTLNEDEWYHVAGTWSSGKLNLYVNGELQSSKSISKTPVVSSGDLHIGNQLGDTKNSYPFDGKIEEVRIWNIAISQADIKRRMYSPISLSDPQRSNLVVNYKFNEGSGQSASDSKNGRNGRLGKSVGSDKCDPDWVLCDVPKPNSDNPAALTFDGNNDYVRVSDHNSLDLTSQGTLEAWVYLTSNSNYGGIIHKGDQTNCE